MGSDTPEGHPVILFDGICNLCVGWVQFIVRRDPDGLFRFAPLQSSVAERLLDHRDVDSERLDTIVLVDGEDCYVKSDAVIRILTKLGGIYRLLGPFGYLPRRLRDWGYDFIAARRYGWFGERDRCMMPTPDIEARFLGAERRTAAS